MSNPRPLRLWTAFLLISLIVGLFSIATHLLVVWQWGARWGVWLLFALFVVAVVLVGLVYRVCVARLQCYNCEVLLNHPLYRLERLPDVAGLQLLDHLGARDLLHPVV